MKKIRNTSHPAAVAGTSEQRRAVAERLFGEIEWESEDAGFCACPSGLNHPDCKIYVDEAPQLDDFHERCRADRESAGKNLRDELAKLAAGGNGASPALSPEQRRRIAEREAKSRRLRELAAQIRERRAGILADNPWTDDSPAPVPDGRAEQAKALIALFPPDDVVWLGQVADSGQPRHARNFRTAKEWASAEGVPPHNFTCGSSFKPGSRSRSNDNVAARRFLTLESDTMTAEETLAAVKWLINFLRLRALVHSGGKSIHAWFEFPSDAALKDELGAVLEALGFDAAATRASQPVRLPGAARPDKGGAIQRLLWIEPDADPDWKPAARLPSELLTAEPVGLRRLSEFSLGENDGGKLLGNRFLCRTGDWLIAAPTGVGKSIFVTQAAMLLALGRDFLGLSPSHPIRSLIIQAENDDGDLVFYRDGVAKFLGLSAEDARAADDNIRVCCESVATGEDFVAFADRALAEWKPDILWVDPLFAYLGSDVSDQKEVSAFLRGGLKNLLKRHDIGGIVMHHTNKPSLGKESRSAANSEYAYMGSGSNELANSFRAVAGLVPTEQDGVYKMVWGKRHGLSGIRDADGKPVREFRVRWAEQERGLGFERMETEATDARRLQTEDELLAIVPPTGTIGRAELEARAHEAGFTVRRFRTLLLLLEEQRRLHRVPVPRPGFKPGVGFSRQTVGGEANVVDHFVDKNRVDNIPPGEPGGNGVEANVHAPCVYTHGDICPTSLPTPSPDGVGKCRRPPDGFDDGEEPAW